MNTDGSPIVSNENHAEQTSSSTSVNINVAAYGNHHQRRLTRNAIFASLTASLGAMSAGTVMAYPSPAVHSINTVDHSPFRVDKNEQSWIGSITALGALVGALVSGPLMDGVGRKMAITMIAVPFIIGWTVEAGAQTVIILCAGRLLTGLCKGVLVGTSHVYTAEIAPSSHRGKLLSAASVANVIGTVCVYSLGIILPWTWLAIACALIPATMASLIATMPETPRYLLLKGNIDSAKQSLEWFRSPPSPSSSEISDELREMDDHIKTGRSDNNRATLLEFLKEPELYKPLIIVLTLFTIQQFSGNSVLRVYAASIFESAGHTIDSQLQSILLGVLGVLGTLVSLATIDRFGRRKLLLISSLLMAVCLGVTGLYFKLFAVKSLEEQHFSWIPLVALVVNNFSFALAYDPIPWMIASELFPTRARGVGNSIGGAWQGICFFLVTKFFHNASDALSVSGAFWIGASVCLIGAVFAIYVLPETKSRTLENIEQVFAQTESVDGHSTARH